MIPKRIPSKNFSKADPGLPAQWLRTTFFQNFFDFVFVKFDCITLIYFNCSQHAMFTICILCSTLTAKHQNIARVCVKGHQNNHV